MTTSAFNHSIETATQLQLLTTNSANDCNHYFQHGQLHVHLRDRLQLERRRDDFDLTVYAGAAAEFGDAEQTKLTLDNARLALQELEKQSAAEYERAQEYTPPAEATTRPRIDYKSIDKEYWPTAASYKTQAWHINCSRPAYTGLSTHNGFVCPYERRNYNANWMATKLRLGASFKTPTIMAPSNLRLSQIWVSDSLGEFVEERGYEWLSLPSLRASTPRLCHGSESDEERDEARTPPHTPLMAKVTTCEIEVEEVSEITTTDEISITDNLQYDPITGAIDLPEHNVKSMETKMARGFANFSSIAEDLTADQILGDAGETLLNAAINEDAIRMLVSNMKARPTAKISIGTAEGIIATSAPAEEVNQIAATDCAQLNDGKNTTSTVADSFIHTKSSAPLRSPSPDLKYIVDPVNLSLIWNTVTSGWFALSSLPWGRMAVAAAGALVDVAVFIARH